jgi:parallel beta-helix repeat protein
LIELNGATAGPGTNGLTIYAGNTFVRGLAINAFDGSGLIIQGLGGDIIQGNYFGIHANGQTAAGNHFYGVLIHNSASNVIGGTGDDARNVISGNYMGGVYLGFEQAYGNLISGNLIGTNAAGNLPVPNQMNGIFVDFAPSNKINDNVVSGNLTNGIKLYGRDSIKEVILRNIIGLSASGNVALPNGGKGFFVNPSSNKRYQFPTTGPNRNVVFEQGSHLSTASRGARRAKVSLPRGGRPAYVVDVKRKHYV